MDEIVFSKCKCKKCKKIVTKLVYIDLVEKQVICLNCKPLTKYENPLDQRIINEDEYYQSLL
jgi:hypothetical protein